MNTGNALLKWLVCKFCDDGVILVWCDREFLLLTHEARAVSTSLGDASDTTSGWRGERSQRRDFLFSRTICDHL